MKISTGALELDVWALLWRQSTSMPAGFVVNKNKLFNTILKRILSLKCKT
jgi:hypothetical protein